MCQGSSLLPTSESSLHHWPWKMCRQDWQHHTEKEGALKRAAFAHGPYLYLSPTTKVKEQAKGPSGAYMDKMQWNRGCGS